jgi:carboxyl-terminal processing protease
MLRSTWIALLLLAATSSTAATQSYDKVVEEAWHAVSKTYVDMPAQQSVWEQARRVFLGKRYPSERAAHAAIRKMLAMLHNSRLQWLSEGDSAAILPQFSAKQPPKLGLAFLSIEFLPDRKRIITPLAGSPAPQAGIRPGDELLSINGTDVKPLSPGELIRLLERAGERSSSKLEIERAGRNKTFIVKPDLDFNHFVDANSENTGRSEKNSIVIREFTSEAVNQFKQLEILRAPDLKNLAIDVRNNPGGLLDAVRDIASYFISDREIICRKDSTGKTDCDKAQASSAISASVTVLVNEGTASAAEIFAAAFQRSGRGKVIGCKTFGHGFGGRFVSLSDGSALLMPDTSYLDANNQPIEGHGITPDVLECSPDLH